MIRGWDDLRTDLATRIRAREWGPGDLIPGEEQLAADYGVARATVNRALRALAEAGVVERRKRAGTRVAALPVRRARLDIPVIRREVEAQGRRYAHRLLSQAMVPLPAPEAARMGLSAGTPSLRLETLHLADDRPHAYELRWLNPAALPPELPDFAAISANEWLVARIPFVAGTLSFGAEPAGATEAQALQVPEGTPVLVVDRVTLDTEGPITCVRLVHGPGYRISLSF